MTDARKTAVYVARVTDGITEIDKIFPPERRALIENTGNESLRRERYSAWKLLEYALSDSRGIDISSIDFKLSEGGKWLADGIYFSLSHTSALVAAAVSDYSVGVDIEEVRRTASARLPERTLTERELREYGTLLECERDEYLIAKWSGKEALFKKEDLSSFVPKSYSPTDKNTVSRKIELDGRTYILTAAADNEAEFFYLFDTSL